MANHLKAALAKRAASRERKRQAAEQHAANQQALRRIGELAEQIAEFCPSGKPSYRTWAKLFADFSQAVSSAGRGDRLAAMAQTWLASDREGAIAAGEVLQLASKPKALAATAAKLREVDDTLPHDSDFRVCLETLESLRYAKPPVAGKRKKTRTPKQWWNAAKPEAPPKSNQHGPILCNRKTLAILLNCSEQSIKGKAIQAGAWIRKEHRTSYALWFETEGAHRLARNRLKQLANK